MKSYNIDFKLFDREFVKAAIIKVCESKRPKYRKPNVKYRITKRKITVIQTQRYKPRPGSLRAVAAIKYRQAREILANIEEYTDKTLAIITEYSAVKTAQRAAQQSGETFPQEKLERVFKPTKPHLFRLRCDNGKLRDIASVPLFPDQVLHQVLINAAQPVFERSFYKYSNGSIPGRGTHKGVRQIKRYIKRHRKSADIKYCAKADVKKCYPSIPHNQLKAKLQKHFRGWLWLSLMQDIIDSYRFRIDESGQPRGLAIGFYTSQWLCNFYLTPLDYHIKQQTKTPFYTRYMDDIALFGRSKSHLHLALRSIIEYMEKLGLTIKPNWQIFRFDYIDKREKRRGRDLDMLGYRFFRDKTILRKRNALAIRRQARKIYKDGVISAKDAKGFLSRIGELKHCDSKEFYKKNVKPYVKIKKIKEVVRYESRKQLETQRGV